ncbi:hypothetical protein C9928_05110 [Pseudidiomarina aestuarii]|uniref:Uncharacterized protein n=1 Tax=Pseudidiomarina aestuarii TaxID=624146 RepID=A0A6N4DF79_9GAMM|nr:hypothetical protein C9928_05110 [Pseudidiomarina aestuarii]
MNGVPNIRDGLATWAVARLTGFEVEAPDDTTPDPFEFEPAVDVALSSSVTSSAITVSGIDAPATVSIDGGEYSIGCGSSFTAMNGSIELDETICVRHQSSSEYSTATTTTLTIGGISADFVSTTMADPGPDPDTTPDAFSFESQTDVGLYSVVTSNTIEITGINMETSVSVSNGLYSLGCSGNFTDEAGTLENGASICVQHTAADVCLTDTTTVLTVGGVQGSFTSTTVDDSFDSDGDGISDCTDPDPYDAQVASVALDGGNSLAMSTDLGAFGDITIIDPDTASNQNGRPEDSTFPYDLVSYTVGNLNPGDSVTVVLEYPAALATGTRIFKYNDTDGFVEFESAEINGATVTLTLTDGGAGDADGEANGTIVDPVGPLLVEESDDEDPPVTPPPPPPEPERSSGSVAWWMIALMLGASLYRRRQQS